MPKDFVGDEHDTDGGDGPERGDSRDVNDTGDRTEEHDHSHWPSATEPTADPQTERDVGEQVDRHTTCERGAWHRAERLAGAVERDLEPEREEDDACHHH